MEWERFLRVILVIFCPVLLVLFPQPVLLAALFETGQNADLILGPYATNATASAIHHASRAMIASNKLFVADTRNNRVLIWNSIPTSNNAPADIVVGQPDFSANFSGGGRTGLNWPIGVFSDGQKLYVADTENYRALIWTNIPSSNGAPADVVLGQPDFYSYARGTNDQSATRWPWDIHFDGQRLYVVCASGGRTMVWTNNVQSITNNQPADLLIGLQYFWQEGSGSEPNEFNMCTPRGIATDGTRLAVSDYNFKRVLFWNNIPTSNGAPADVVLFQTNFYNYVTDSDVGHGAIWMYGSNLFTGGNAGSYQWTGFPTNNGQPPSVTNIRCQAGSSLWGVYYEGGKFVAADCGASRVLIYSSMPTNAYQDVDVVVGQSNQLSNIFLSRQGIRTTTDILSTGKKLLISVGADGRVVIHQEMPTVCGENADNIIGMKPFGAPLSAAAAGDYITEPGQVWSDGIRLFVLDKIKGVLMWNRIPTNDNVAPYRIIEPMTVQGQAWGQVFGMTFDGQRLYVSDWDNKRIMIWNEILAEGSSSNQPDVVLNLDSSPGLLSSDGTRLAVAAMESGILIWTNIPSTNNTPADIELLNMTSGMTNDHFNIPLGVQIFEDKLFVADSGYGRVCIFNTFPTNGSQFYDVQLGQTNATEKPNGKSYSKMFMPRGVCFDGEYLWVSEFKFADRALRFHANIGTNPPTAPSSLWATCITNKEVDLAWNDNSTNESFYAIRYGIVGSGSTNVYGYLTVNSTNVSVTGLSRNTNYFFSVSAGNSYGESSAVGIVTNTPAYSNSSPSGLSAVSPTNGQGGVSECYLVLKWLCSDPDQGDQMTYDLYFGTTTNYSLHLLSEGQENKSYYDLTHTLAGLTYYYWQVVAHDLEGATNQSPVWQFQTCSLPLGEDVTLSITNGPGGVVLPSKGTYSYRTGASILLRAFPSNYWSFARWDGLMELQEEENPAESFFMSNTTVRANFSETLLTNSVPQIWLAQYGLGTNDAAALTDSDSDGMANWQEYVAGTVPTNVNDLFSLNITQSNGYPIIVMPTRSGNLTATHTNRYYSLQEKISLSGGSSWSNVIQNRLGDNKECAFTNQGTCPAFYRGVVFVE